MEQKRARVRYERILDAALAVFSSQGYRDAAMDDIAAASATSKGGVYFHFPGKQAVFLALLNRTAALLRNKIVAAIAAADEPIAKADAGLRAVVETFSSHRGMARLFMVEALGAGRDFHQRMAEIREEFAGLIKSQLDQAIVDGLIAAVDTEITSRAWFGAVYEVITHWLLAENPPPLIDSYATLEPLLRNSVGFSEPSP